MWVNIGFIIIGIVLLYGGAELIVEASRHLANSWRIGEYLVGSSLVAFATSMPEAVTTLTAQAENYSGDLIMGNLIGSNIANLGLILGIGLLIRPAVVQKMSLKRPLLFQLFMYILLFALMLFKPLRIWQGLILLALFFLYYFFQFKRDHSEDSFNYKNLNLAAITRSLVGAGLLFLGAQKLLQGSAHFGHAFGLSNRVIGLTFVAIGTSLPELSTTMIAVIKKREEVLIGNLLGSNLFNILFILPLALLVSPLFLSSPFLIYDLFLAFLFTTLLLLFERYLNRIAGIFLLLSYFSYLYFINQ
ncbi:MAG: sodium:calcium antiporter [Simkaniaceae bacterium]